MSEAELIFAALAELSTRQIAETDAAVGLPANKKAAKTGGGIAHRARLELESETGRKVVTGENSSAPLQIEKEPQGLREDCAFVAQMCYNTSMATNAVVRSRIDAEVKQKAAAVLEEMGLTVSDVMRIVLTRVAKENALPFELKPNKLTRQTMRKTAQGEEVHQAKDAADLFHKLGL